MWYLNNLLGVLDIGNHILSLSLSLDKEYWYKDRTYCNPCVILGSHPKEETLTKNNDKEKCRDIELSPEQIMPKICASFELQVMWANKSCWMFDPVWIEFSAPTVFPRK